MRCQETKHSDKKLRLVSLWEEEGERHPGARSRRGASRYCGMFSPLLTRERAAATKDVMLAPREKESAAHWPPATFTRPHGAMAMKQLGEGTGSDSDSVYMDAEQATPKRCGRGMTTPSSSPASCLLGPHGSWLGKSGLL